MAAVLLGLLVVGCVVVWLHRAGRLGDVANLGRDTKAQLFPTRPISRKALPRRLLREAENTKTIGVSGNVLLPTRIEIAVNPEDIAPFEDATDWLQRDIADALRAKAVEQGWVLPDGPEVAIVADPERPVGVPRAVGRIGALQPGDVQTLVRPDPVRPEPEPDAESGEDDGESAATQAVDPPTMAAPELAATQRVETFVALKLVSMHGDGADLSVPLVAGGKPQVLGRSAGVDLVVTDGQVSGQHCSFSAGDADADSDEPTVTVEDLGSTNGTFVDGERITKADLRSGSIVRAGKTAWRVEL